MKSNPGCYSNHLLITTHWLDWTVPVLHVYTAYRVRLNINFHIWSVSSIDKRYRLTLLQAGNVLRQNGVSDIHHFLINSQIAGPVMYHFDTHCCRIWIEERDCQFNSRCNSFNEGSDTNLNFWYSTFLELDIQADTNVATDACDAACVGIIAICVLTIAAVLIAMILLGRSKKKEKKRKGIQ